jgi:hypothetical protein
MSAEDRQLVATGLTPEAIAAARAYLDHHYRRSREGGAVAVAD